VGTAEGGSVRNENPLRGDIETTVPLEFKTQLSKIIAF
jgi:hypothetical protein